MSAPRTPADGWEAHRQMELEAMLKTTPAQRLRWLEAAIKFAFEAGALPRPRASDDPTAAPEEQ